MNLPELAPLGAPQREPISFVTVRFSDEYLHNIARSDCVQRAENQLITVDNRSNLFFDNLGLAINSGLAQARHDLIVVVHEDVLLARHWEQHFFRSLAALEAAGQDWALLGCVGWPDAIGHGGLDSIIGHWTDPRGHRDTLGGRAFAEVQRLDEQLLVLRRSQGVQMDPKLPGIHNIGRDLPLTLAKTGRKTFVIDAPTIHKFADSAGRPIMKAADSDKIKDRRNPIYLADRAISDDYFRAKWSLEPPADLGQAITGSTTIDEHPLFLIGTDISETRLLTAIAGHLGICSIIDESQQACSQAIYKGVIHKLRGSSAAAIDRCLQQFHAQQAEQSESRFGVALPEAGFLVSELARTYPGAYFLLLHQDPLQSCLQPAVPSARLDNQLGRLALPEAYRFCHRPVTQLLDDPPIIRNACAIRHRISLVIDALARLPEDAYTLLQQQAAIDQAQQFVSRLAKHLGLTDNIGNFLPPGLQVEQASWQTARASGYLDLATAILQPLRRRLGYLPPEKPQRP